MQIFYRRSKAALDFHKIVDPKLKKILTDSYKLSSQSPNFQYGAPLFMSSANNWVLTRFLDVKIFS